MSPANSANGLRKSQERIYSSQQLVTALKSALDAVRDQLSVLTILDSSASSWPGIQQATEDLEFLVEMSSKVNNRMEKEARDRDAELADVKAEVNTLKETLSLQQDGKDKLARDLASTSKELKAATANLDTAKQEVAQQKQELWALERQRADLASEMERVKQDNEFMEGEISTLRATVTEQMSQITELKEDLAGRKADVGHLQQITSDQKLALEHTRQQLDDTVGQLREVQGALTQVQAEREHHEREADRLHEECAKLGSELDKTSKELERVKDWQEVLKKVEADKLREAEEERMNQRLQYEAQKAALDKSIVALQSQLKHTQEKLQAKDAEVEALKKQLGLASVTTKGLQTDLASMAAERAAVQRQCNESKSQVTKLMSEVQALQLAAMQADKAYHHALSDARAYTAVEVSQHKAGADESKREAAVQKALAEGWSRDLREVQQQLKQEQEKSSNLQSKLDDLARGEQEGKMDTMKMAATAESRIATLQQQLDAAQFENRKIKAEYNSDRKRLEKQVEALQRECEEGAREVKRLRMADVPQLPPLRQPVTMQDELNNMKRVLNGLAASSVVPSRLPALGKLHPGQLSGSSRAQVTR